MKGNHTCEHFSGIHNINDEEVFGTAYCYASLIFIKSQLASQLVGERQLVKKIGQFSGTRILQTTELIFFNLVAMQVRLCNYMEGIKYMNLVKINPLVIEIQGVEISKLKVPGK